MLTTRPAKWGTKLDFDDASVACTYADPNSVRYNLRAHAVLIFFTPEPQWRVALNSDREQVGLAPAGSVEIVPADSEVFARWSAHKHSLRFNISPDRLQRLAVAEFDVDTFELEPCKIGLVDRKALTIAHWMRTEVQNNDLASREALDALTVILGIHLLREYSSLNVRSSSVLNGGLAPRIWRAVSEYVQENLTDALTLERLSSIAGLSPSHFARAFKQTTGQSPHQYVMECRLTLARRLIMNTSASMDNIARTAGFSSNSHMTALMRRTWNMTPTALRTAAFKSSHREV